MPWMHHDEACEALGLSVISGTLRAMSRAGRIKRKDGHDGRPLFFVPKGRIAQQHIDSRVPDRQIRTSTNVHRIMVFSDVHWPREDSRVWYAAMKFAKDAKPDEVIFLGDCLDMESCSTHGGEVRPALLTEECAYAEARLDEVAAAVGDKCAMTWLDGNHEHRLTRVVTDRVPNISGTVTLPKLLNFRERGIAYHKYGTTIKRGRLHFTHGWYCNEYVAAKMVKAVGSCVFGHAHRVQTHSVRGPDGEVHTAYGMPTMEQDPGWLHGAPHHWSHGWGWAEIHQPTGRFQFQQILAHDGVAVWNGVAYGVR